MKYSAVIVAALAAVASAQDISIFPSCSLPCILDAVGTATTCTTTDYPCICNNMDALVAAATTCVVEKCGADVALNTVLPATKTFCANVGSAPAAGTTSAAAEPETTYSAAPVSSASSAVYPAGNSTTVAYPTGSAAPTVVTPTTAAPSSVVTAGAARLGSLGAAAALMVAAFAL